MTQPVIITVAITGAVPRKATTLPCRSPPASRSNRRTRPMRPAASLVHIHVRNPDESPGSDPAKFAEVQEGVRKHCPGMIIQFLQPAAAAASCRRAAPCSASSPTWLRWPPAR